MTIDDRLLAWRAYRVTQAVVVLWRLAGRTPPRRVVIRWQQARRRLQELAQERV